jgi:hypothetical protein
LRALVSGISEAALNGTGNVSETLTNTTTTAKTVTYVYTLTADGCTNTQNVTVTDKPKPTLTSATSATAICSGTKFDYTATSGVSGTTFSWSRALVSGISEAASNGTGNVSETLTNTTTTAKTVTYVYTLTADGCTNTQNVTVSVKPKPTLTSVTSATAICSGTKFDYTATSGVSGTTFSWSRALVSGISEAASNGTGNVSETLTNTTTTAKTVTYVYTLTANGCTNTQNVTVSVKPKPTLTSATSATAICSGTKFDYTATSGVSGTTFNWSRALVSGISEVASNGTGNVSETLTNTTTTAKTVTYVYTLTADGCTNTQNVTVSVYGKLSAGTISSDQIICYGKTPEQLNSGSPSGGAGGYTYQWEQSATGSTGWAPVTGATSASYSPPALTQTTWYRRKVTDSKCGYAYSSNTVEITVRHSSLYNYPDLRVRVCPDAGTSINLSKYIDTLDLNGVPQWKSLSGVPMTSVGVISANNLSTSPRVHTFTYTVSNPCMPEGVTRKVYLEVLKAGRMRPFRDTIVMCPDYAEVVNINQIFGIDAGFDDNTWSYYSWTTGDVDKHVTISKSSTYYGAVVMNGKEIYNNSDIGSYIYHGISTKKVVFTYTVRDNSCLKKEDSYTIVIILTPNLL